MARKHDPELCGLDDGGEPVCPGCIDEAAQRAKPASPPKSTGDSGSPSSSCTRSKGRKTTRQKAKPSGKKSPANAGANGTGGAADNKPKMSQADVLVSLAAGVELFHTPGGNDSEPFACVTVGGHRETWAVNGNGFRRYLSRLFYESVGRTPSDAALQDAINVLAGRAQFDGPERPVAVRLAEYDGAIYLDLADSDWSVVRVTADGWEVTDDSPVRFVRRRGMLALPTPVAGGSVEELRPLVNLTDDADWRLAVAWLLAALRPGRPFPLLAVNGEQGSAKSTLCRLLRALVDPNVAPLRRQPRNDRDLMIAASNGWVMAFDNLSGVRPDLSDALCSLATGGGFATRELYTDDGEKLIDAMRPILLNGIDDILTRPDLLDRAITLTLKAIADRDRLEESELYRRFEVARPRVLGALLTAVSVALRNAPGVRLAEKPRMADFATWVVAAEPALGWPVGSFMAAYAANRAGSNALALDSSPVATAIVALVDREVRWTGLMKGLLAALSGMANDAVKRSDDWPKSAKGMGSQLRRFAPALRRAGIDIDIGERMKLGVPVTLERRDQQRTGCSQPSPDEARSEPGGERRERCERAGAREPAPNRGAADDTEGGLIE